MAHFAPESLAHFAPESLAHFTPELVAHFTPEYSGHWLLTQLIPSPYKIHSNFAKKYENRSEIQRIIGIEIPKYKIIYSKLNHLREREFEFKVNAKLEFETLPGENFYSMLDSIIMVPISQKPDENSSFFYYGLEGI